MTHTIDVIDFMLERRFGTKYHVVAQVELELEYVDSGYGSYEFHGAPGVHHAWGWEIVDFEFDHEITPMNWWSRFFSGPEHNEMADYIDDYLEKNAEKILKDVSPPTDDPNSYWQP